MGAPPSFPPVPPEYLEGEAVTLRFAMLVAGDAARGFVPYYHFRILVGGTDVGHINLRIGDTEHVLRSAAHVGFEIAEPHRGHRYAVSACRTLASFARSISERFILTCDPDNHPSRRTLELLGAAFIDEVPVPVHDPHYVRGSRTKLRFDWAP